jgi:large subunit ribosomal protein L29
MKAIELKEMAKEELIELLQKSKAKLVKLRFDVANKQQKNYKEITVVKKDIARIKTQLRVIN